MRLCLLLIFLIGGSEVILFAQSSSAKTSVNSSQPKLVVGIVVDQMRYDYLTRYASKYGPDGFNRLLAEGFNCTEHYINYIPTNTAPGHATIYTGANPKDHGIIENSWYNRALGLMENSVQDTIVEPIGTGSKHNRHSPKNLQVPTLTDVYKGYHEKSKVISIALKSRTSILPGGHLADAAYWFRGVNQGGWITTSYYMKKLPDWVLRFNESNSLEEYMNVWEPLLPISEYHESIADNNPYERGFKKEGQSVFPYDLKVLGEDNGGFDIIKTTPFGNSFTFDFAKAAMASERLGRDKDTDFLLIGISATDYIGHNFGVTSVEMEDTFIRLDLDIANFLKELDKRVGKNNYTLFLTSDHGALENTNYLETQGIAGGVFKEGILKNELKNFVFDNFGTVEIIENLSYNQIYLNRKIIEELGLDLAQVTREIKEFLTNYPHIKGVFTSQELLSKTYDSGDAFMIQQGFFPERSGDILYELDRNFVVYSGTGSDHGSGYEYDTHVPLLFYGCGITPGSTTELTHPVDIVTTLSALLNIPKFDTFVGRIISEVFE